MKKIIFILSFFTICVFSIYSQTVFELTFWEHSDGCLVYGMNGHYDVSGRHRNDNAYVNGEINRFNSLVRQYGAISLDEQKAGARADYVYFILSEQKWDSYEGRTVMLKTYSISRVSSSSSGGYSGGASGGSSYSPSDSNYLMIGYNFAYGAPFGITLADSMFFERSLMYISANFGYSSDPGRLDIEWIYGIAIAINDWLRIPIGIGGNHIGRDGEKITGSSTINGNTTYYTDVDPLAEWEHAFVIEAGLHATIVERFYLTATYRLKGFSNSGFSVGIGLVF